MCLPSISTSRIKFIVGCILFVFCCVEATATAIVTMRGRKERQDDTTAESGIILFAMNTSRFSLVGSLNPNDLIQFYVKKLERIKKKI